MVFIGVKEKIQKIRLHFLPSLTKMSAWNSSFCPVPGCAWGPQKEISNSETLVNKQSHLPTELLMRGKKCPYIFCQLEVKIFYYLKPELS